MRKMSSHIVVCLLFCFTLNAFAQNKCVIPPIPPTKRVRVNATSTTGVQQLKLYADGVKAMKLRPATDPTSWTYQAAMHGTYTTPAKPLWNTCQHGNYFFLSWHRMYLYFFERIVRAASNPKFNLPYWDYDNPTSATDPKLQLPPQFRDPTNPLYVPPPDRDATMDAGGFLPVGDVPTNYSMSRMQFTCGATNWASSFGGKQVPAPVHFASGFGALESLPHNAVHDDVGGGGWMSDPNTAAQDPIFWLHHANIDRLWDSWETLDSGRSNNWDALWLSQKFYFFDEHGKQCYLTGKDVIHDATQLGYVYQSVKVPMPPNKVTCPPKRTPLFQPRILAEFAPSGRVALGAAPSTVEVPLKEVTPPAPPKKGVAAAPTTGKRVIMTLEDIQFDKSPGMGYEVYLNLPAGQEPSIKSPSYVGTIHFFGLKHSRDESHEATLQFDITDTVAALRKQNLWQGQAKVTTVPRGPTPKEGPAPQARGGASIGKVVIVEQ
jgi:tyrosinase